MKKLSLSWTVNKFTQENKRGAVSFDYPIQREGNQWDLLQKSLLIHSLAEDYPVPNIYTIAEKMPVKNERTGKTTNKNVYQVLDGKQRLTTIKDYLINEFELDEDTPNVTIYDEEYVIAGKVFDDLDKEVQEAILNFELLVYKLEDATDEQIEDLFFRLNNGTPLSKQQKAKGKMGKGWATIIKDLVNHELIQEKASFTELQKRKADDEMAIIQTMMILDKEYNMKSISSNDAYKYCLDLKGNDKQETIDEIRKAMDYITKALESADTEKVMLKKVHFPMTVVTALSAIQGNISTEIFFEWMQEFKRAFRGAKTDFPTDYKEHSGAGSVKGEKTMGRIKSMSNHFYKFVEYKKSITPITVEDELDYESDIQVEEEVLTVVEPTENDGQTTIDEMLEETETENNVEVENTETDDKVEVVAETKEKVEEVIEIEEEK